MSFKTRRFIPRLVALDDRCLPTVTAGIVPGTTILQITGDDTANTIQISDNATTITVTGDGVTQTFDATLVSSIVVNALAGDDVVQFNLSGAQATTLLVTADLGKGADTFTTNLDAQISGSGTNVGISCNGDGGGDSLVFNATAATTVAVGANLSVSLSGQAGHDSIAFNYDPSLLVNGNVTLTKDQRH